jgi:hypothetical protein
MGFIRFVVMAIGLLVPANAIGRLFYGALSQIPGTVVWNYGLWGYAVLNMMAIASIVAPKKVGQPAGLIAIGLISLRTTTTYCAAFANGTIGLMALSVGHLWGWGIAGHWPDLFSRHLQPPATARATMKQSEYNAANRLGEVI